jgi:hypothetical protein
MSSHAAAEWLTDPLPYRHERQQRTVQPPWERTRHAAVTHERFQGLVIERLRTALHQGKTPWRTLDSLATQLDIDTETVLEALRAMGDEVRRPVGARGAELRYYRLTSDGYTWQERWRQVTSVLGRTPLRP